VVIAARSFTMGSRASELEHDSFSEIRLQLDGPQIGPQPVVAFGAVYPMQLAASHGI